MSHNNLPVEKTDDVIKEVEELSNTILVVTCSIGKSIQYLMKLHKHLRIKMPYDEHLHYNNIINACKCFQNKAKDNLDVETLKQFNNAIITCNFVFFELISRCESNNMKLWQFHNLLKTYPITYPAISKYLDNENQAFCEVFGYNSDGTPISQTC